MVEERCYGDDDAARAGSTQHIVRTSDLSQAESLSAEYVTGKSAYESRRSADPWCSVAETRFELGRFKVTVRKKA